VSAKLNIPGAARDSSDFAKRGVSESAVRVAKAGMIEQIRHVSPDLKRHTFAKVKWEILCDAEVHIAEVRPRNDAASAIAKRSVRWSDKGSGVEPLSADTHV